MKQEGGRGRNVGPLFIAFAAFLWTTDAFVRTTLEGVYTPNQLVTMEHFIIFIVMIPILFKSLPKLGNFTRLEWGALLVIGIGGSAIATIALTTAFFTGFPFQYAAVIVLLQQTQPIIAIGMAHILLREKLPKYYYPLSIMAIFGVYLIVFPILSGFTNTLSGLSIIETHLKDPLGLQASLLGFLAAFLWGSSTVFGRYLLEHSPTKVTYKEMTSYRFVVAFLFLLLLVLIPSRFGGEGLPVGVLIPSFYVFGQLLYLALIVGLLSLVLYYFGLKSTHASIATLFELAYPLSFFIILPFVNGELLTNVQMAGALILILSTTTISYLYSSNSQQNENATQLYTVP